MKRRSCLQLALDLDETGPSQEREVLLEALELLKPVFQPDLLSITGQDQAAGPVFVWTGTSAAGFLIFRLLEQLIYPIPFCGSLGYGPVKEENTSPYEQKAYEFSRQVMRESQRTGSPAIFYNAGFFEDNLVNSQFLSWFNLKTSQSALQRSLTLAYELQNPIYLSGVMSQISWSVEALNRLQDRKKQLVSVHHPNDDIWDFDFSQAKPTRWVDIHDQLDLDRFTIQGFFQKGYATAISKMVGTSRQNIDYHLKNGRFEDERNQTVSLILTLMREEAAIPD